MKKYRVTVNGTVYEVELEELTGSAPVSAPAAPAGAVKIYAQIYLQAPAE